LSNAGEQATLLYLTLLLSPNAIQAAKKLFTADYCRRRRNGAFCETDYCGSGFLQIEPKRGGICMIRESG